MAARFWLALDTAGHRLKLRCRKRICARLEAALLRGGRHA